MIKYINIDHVAKPIYIFSLLLVHIGYLAVFLGIFATIPILIKYLNVAIQFFLCFFLMIRFHPFREKYQLQSIDITFIFGSAFILFTNLVLVELIQIPEVGNYINSGLKMFGKTTQTPTLQLSISKS
jgi:hypothetical protein